MVKRYFDLSSLATALELITSSYPAPGRFETIHISGSLNRITSAPVIARYTVPSEDVSAMDGIAVKSSDTFDAAEQNPVNITNAVLINTGNPVPSGYDAVIMIEEVWDTGEGGSYTIRKPAAPGQNIRKAGEDISEADMVLPENHCIQAADIGAIASCGISHVDVKTINAGLLPTGDEVVPLGTVPERGKVIESNTYLAEAFIKGIGGHCTRYPIVPDDPVDITKSLLQAVRDNDFVIMTAGTSAGTHDFTAQVIGENGDIILHGVAIKPGKPVIFGKIYGKPVIGLPGYPISALTVLRELVTPLFTRWGFCESKQELVSATLSQTLNSEIGVDEFVLISLSNIRDRWVASPQSRGSGVQMSAVKSNAYLHIPAINEGYEALSNVEVILSGDLSTAKSSIILTGSLDHSLDRVVNLSQKKGLWVQTYNVGNIEGLLSLKKDTCHAALIHLSPRLRIDMVDDLLTSFSHEDFSFVTIYELQVGFISRTEVNLSDPIGERSVVIQKETIIPEIFQKVFQEFDLKDHNKGQTFSKESDELKIVKAINTTTDIIGFGKQSVAEKSGLCFSPVTTIIYQMIFRKELHNDERMKTLLNLIKSLETC